MRRNMAKPLQGREMSAVTISVSVTCLPVSGSAAEQVSLETRLKQLQRLKIPVLFWQPVPCQRRHGERTFSEICLSPDNDEVTASGRSKSASATASWHKLTEVYKIVLRCQTTLSLVDQQTDRVCINEADHTAHDWWDQTYSVHRWVVQRCSSLPAVCWVDTEALHQETVTVVDTWYNKTVHCSFCNIHWQSFDAGLDASELVETQTD